MQIPHVNPAAHGLRIPVAYPAMVEHLVAEHPGAPLPLPPEGEGPWPPPGYTEPERFEPTEWPLGEAPDPSEAWPEA